MGELPDGAPEKHGWRWRDTEYGDWAQESLWVARSLPDANGAVRLGYIADGEPAHVGQDEQAVDEYKPSRLITSRGGLFCFGPWDAIEPNVQVRG